MRRVAMFIGVCAVCVAHAQTESVGKWVGKLLIQEAKAGSSKFVPMPGAPGQVVYTLEIRKNGTYFTTITGTPDKKPHTAEGAWKRAGNKITLTVQKRDGKPDTSEPRTRILSMSADGKSLSTPMQGQVSVRGPKGETTPPKGFVPPKISLVFKKS